MIFLNLCELHFLMSLNTQNISLSQHLKSGCFTLISFGLLVFLKSTGEGSRPHVQGRSSREGEEEEEGNLETKPVHHASGQSAEHQLPQHLESGQETVVGRLKGERQPRGRMRGKEIKRRREREERKGKRRVWERKTHGE